jgi:mono/diheme cytochrome c family protein
MTVSSGFVRVLRVVFLMSTVALLAQARTVWDGVYSDAQAKRGAALFADRCSTCHAPDLSGIDQAPALTGADFAMDWDTLSMNDLFERTRVSMPADKPGTLTPPEVADVLAFVLQKNAMPSGASDLPTDADALKAIKYTAKKP